MKKFFAIFIILLIAQISSSQNLDLSEPLDEFGESCGESLKARFDNISIFLQEMKGSKAYIIFYGGENEGKNQNYLQFFKSYLINTRGFNKERIIIKRGANSGKMKVQVYVISEGTKKLPEPITSFIEPKYNSPALFDKSWADVWESNTPSDVREDWDFLDNSLLNDGCHVINLTHFANELKNNPSLSGYVVIYTAFGKGRKRANRVANVLLRDLRRLKISSKRIKTVYGGNRDESEVEFWLVAEGQKLPKAIPDKRKAS